MSFTAPTFAPSSTFRSTNSQKSLYSGFTQILKSHYSTNSQKSLFHKFSKVIIPQILNSHYIVAVQSKCTRALKFELNPKPCNLNPKP
jgi:hypothetical protein